LQRIDPYVAIAAQKSSPFIIFSGLTCVKVLDSLCRGVSAAEWHGHSEGLRARQCERIRPPCPGIRR